MFCPLFFKYKIQLPEISQFSYQITAVTRVLTSTTTTWAGRLKVSAECSSFWPFRAVSTSVWYFSSNRSCLNSYSTRCETSTRCTRSCCTARTPEFRRTATWRRSGRGCWTRPWASCSTRTGWCCRRWWSTTTRSAQSTTSASASPRASASASSASTAPARLPHSRCWPVTSCSPVGGCTSTATTWRPTLSRFVVFTRWSLLCW